MTDWKARAERAETDDWKARAERAEAALGRIAAIPALDRRPTPEVEAKRIAREALAAVQPNDNVVAASNAGEQVAHNSQPEAPCPTRDGYGVQVYGDRESPCPTCGREGR